MDGDRARGRKKSRNNPQRKRGKTIERIIIRKEVRKEEREKRRSQLNLAQD